MDDSKKATNFVETIITGNDVVVFSTSTCKYCVKVKELFTVRGIKHFSVNIDSNPDFILIANDLYRRTRQKTVPNVFVKGHHIGGYDDVLKTIESGVFDLYLEGKFPLPFDYDLIVIGGGSGGISAAKEAARQRKRVAIFDFVKPTIHGTVWGVGGTCANVGCIPKKLMHEAGIIGDVIEDNRYYGWNVPKPPKSEHVWSILIQNVQKLIKKINFNHLKYFKLNNIDYFNEMASFKNLHTIEGKSKKGSVKTYTSHMFILSVGGRPTIPNFPGNDLVITSDDLFSLKEKPGKTLLVGASYIALECAGFLNRLGISCSILVRSVVLRGFDQQIAEMISSHLTSLGISFIRGYEVGKIEKGAWSGVDPSEILKVTLVNKEGKSEIVNYYNVVVMAIGRTPQTTDIGLESISLKLNEINGKVIVDNNQRTSCHTVYAIGDVQDGGVELTPVAVKSGQMLVRKLFGSGGKMDFNLIPTTLFTPIEYGVCGLSEEKAIEIYKASEVECFHSTFQPFHWLLQNRNLQRSYAKLVCVKNLNMKVVGIHIFGPNAGEIIIGFALALKMNATKFDFDKLVGVHPTSAEVFTGLRVTRAEQPVPTESSC